LNPALCAFIWDDIPDILVVAYIKPLPATAIRLDLMQAWSCWLIPSAAMGEGSGEDEGGKLVRPVADWSRF
jgi:hypothetical protein